MSTGFYPPFAEKVTSIYYLRIIIAKWEGSRGDWRKDKPGSRHGRFARKMSEKREEEEEEGEVLSQVRARAPADAKVRQLEFSKDDELSKASESVW